MSTEITLADEATEAPPPDPKDVKPNGAKAKAKEKDKEHDEEREREKDTAGSPILRQMRLSEDMSLKDVVDQFGTDGSYSIRISRKWPESIIEPASGKRIQTAGFLCKTDKAIDEEWIKEHYGGGTYELVFRKKDGKGQYIKGGSYNRTFNIAGEPSIHELPRAPQGPVGSSAPQSTEAPPSVVNKTLDFMEKQLERAQDRAERPTGRGSDDAMVEILRDELRESRARNERLMERLDDVQRQISNPPQSAEDQVRGKLFEKLIDQDSARIQAVRTQFESEIRQLKEAHHENERRMQDRFDRERDQLARVHERELAAAKGSFDIQLQAARSSFEISLQAEKSATQTQRDLLNAEIKRLERDNADLRDDLKELRAKKDKTFVEQVADIEKVKEALGMGDEGDKSTAEKIIEAVTNPEAIAAVGQMIGKGGAQPPMPPPAPAPEPRLQRPRVVRDKETGTKFIVGPDGKTLRPARPAPIPGQPQLPAFPPEVIEQVVGFLERAYAAGTDPEIVAQSGKAMVPEPILMAIRDVGGVDAFLTKVAKLPNSSPLSSNQAGKNWVRKVGKHLVGE